MYHYNETKLQIETERLILRPFIESDAVKVAHYCNDEVLNRGVAGLPLPYTIDHAITWFNRQKEENYSFYDFAIVDKKTSELLGSISLSNRINQHVGELGYWIGRAHWHKGYATEASKAMIQFAFNAQNYHKVYARHFLSNPNSGKVMINSGMIQEGIQNDHFYKNDHYETIVLYGIIKSE